MCSITTVFLSCIKVSSLNEITISILSAYIFVLLLKLYYLFSIRKSLKPHVHSLSKPDKVVFYIKYDFGDFFTPTPRLCITICRTNGDDSENWKGKYFSDMLNPNKFTGAYVKHRETLSENDLGWHDLVLFPKQNMIALTINHIEVDANGKKSWNTTGGYFIYRRDNCR